MSFDYHLHIFRSPRFQSVVNEAIAFFNETPICEMPPAVSFAGTGVYALYYSGSFDLYAEIVDLKQKRQSQPIYIGKAVPLGWRTGRSQEADVPVLYRRLREHAGSIEQAVNLEIASFQYRFVILGGIESDLVVPVEAALIRRYNPLWNSVIEGFGNHDPGRGRYNQAKSEWDVLHPGRPWADKLTGESPRLEEIVEEVQQSLPGIS